MLSWSIDYFYGSNVLFLQHFPYTKCCRNKEKHFNLELARGQVKTLTLNERDFQEFTLLA